MNDNINIKITLQNIPREVSLKLAEMHKAGILGYYISNLIISNEYSRSKGTKVPQIVTGDPLELDPKKILPNNKKKLNEVKDYGVKENELVPGIDKELIELMKEELRKELQEDMRKDNQEDPKDLGGVVSDKVETKEGIREESEGSIIYEDDAEDFINDLMSI